MPQLIGTAPNQIPLNGFLGDLAFQDALGVNIGGGSISGTDITLYTFAETLVAQDTVAATATLSITAGTIVTATLTSATPCTFTMPAVGAGKQFKVFLKQPASGTATTATFTGVKWGTAGAPTITATLGRMDILTFVSDGVSWYGTIAQGFTY